MQKKIVGDGSNFIPDNVDDEINTIMTQKLYSTENNYDFTDRDSPWMQAMRRKVAQGGISDSRFEVAEKLLASKSKFLRLRLEKLLELTVHTIVNRSSNESGSSKNEKRNDSIVANEFQSNGKFQRPRSVLSTSTFENNVAERPLTLWAAKSLIPLLAAPSLEHHRWIEAVVPLLDVLNSLPPLSLRDENMEMIESLQNALLQPHNVNAAADGERRRIATSTALATALQHGALGPILVVVKTLLQAAQSQRLGTLVRIPLFR